MTRRGERVGAQWLPVTRGARRHVDAEDAFVAELLAWQEVLPAAARFTHLTAARLRGWWLPPLPAGLPVFVSTELGSRVRRAGLRAIRRRELAPARKVAGVRVDPPAAILAACAADLGVLDLTCLIDAARREGEVTVSELVAAAQPGSRGRSRLLLATARSHWKADSIYEVLLRELHRSVGVEVEPQHVVLDDQGGFVAKGDLRLVGTRHLPEYDGGDHLERRQQRKDRKRAAPRRRKKWALGGVLSPEVGLRLPTRCRLRRSGPHAPCATMWSCPPQARSRSSRP